jgi:hypothetical protein
MPRKYDIKHLGAKYHAAAGYLSILRGYDFLCEISFTDERLYIPPGRGE